MRRVMMFLVVSVLAGAIVAPVHAVVGAGVSLPLWSEKVREAHAGATQLVSFADHAGAESAGWWSAGDLYLRRDSLKFFPELQQLVISAQVIGVKPKSLLTVDTSLSSHNCLLAANDKLWVSVGDLPTGEVVLTTRVVQNESRKDKGGFLPKFLQLVGFKTHKLITKEDTQVDIIRVAGDIAETAAAWCKASLGRDDPATMSPLEREAFRSYYYWKVLQPSIQLANPPLEYGLWAEAIARGNAGLPMPLQAGKSQLQIECDTLRLQAREFEEAFKAADERAFSLSDALADVQCQLRGAIEAHDAAILRAEQAEGDKATLQRELEIAEDNVDKAEKAVKAAGNATNADREALETLRRERDEAIEARDAAIQAAEQAEVDLATKSEELRIARCNAQKAEKALDKANLARDEAVAALATVTRERDEAYAGRDEAVKRAEQAEADKATLQRKLEIAEGNVAKLREALEAEKARVAALQPVDFVAIRKQFAGREGFVFTTVGGETITRIIWLRDTAGCWHRHSNIAINGCTPFFFQPREWRGNGWRAIGLTAGDKPADGDSIMIGDGLRIVVVEECETNEVR